VHARFVAFGKCASEWRQVKLVKLIALVSSEVLLEVDISTIIPESIVVERKNNKI